MGPASAVSPSRSLRLPAQPTPLVGRADELAAVHRLVEGDARLLTLTGPAGVGKTRLALAAAAALAEQAPDRFPDGVAWVDLAPVRDPQGVLGAIGRAFGFTDTGFPPLGERLATYLGERALLLALDNFEQVLPAAGVLADLLAGCSRLALLVTSRVPLALRWERALRIAPLPVPDLREALPPLDVLLAVPAVALFVERARAHSADFALTERQAPLLARLAVDLDGLPLALELAAARLDVLSLPALARRLGNRLRLLAFEAPDRPERQRSLEAAVGWSYDLLPEPERRLFRCLGVFAGRVALDAIAAVAGAVGAAADDGEARQAREAGRALHRLISLAEKSLLLPLPARPEEPGWLTARPGHDGEREEPEEDADPEPAFGTLETVREYAWERLASVGELALAQRAHARYFTALAERAAPELRGRAQRAWFFRLERELDNLRAALRWLLDQDDAAERAAGLRLAGALGWFWWRRGYHAEGLRWLEEALARAPQGEGAAGTDPDARTRALLFAGALLPLQGEVARARALLGEALALAEQRHDLAAAAEAHTFLGVSAVTAGEVTQATPLLGEALRRWEALGNPHGLGETLFYLGVAADFAGDYAAAAARYADALQQLGAAGDAQGAGFVHCYFGVAEWRRGELPSAMEHIQAGVRTGVAFRDRWLLGVGAQAAMALVGVRAEPAARARLLGAADALAQATGAMVAWEGLPGGQDVAGLRARLARVEEGEVEGGAAYREGRVLPFGAVATLALRLMEEFAQALPQPAAAPAGAQTPAQPSPRRAERSLLSAREAEVLRLVAEGLSNKAIGKQLFVSPSTVNYHLTSAFNKLGVDTRAQAVAVASQRGLL